MVQKSNRNGGDLIVETLEKLGAKMVFGIPGQHALGLFDALSRSSLEFVSSRVENNAALAADGYSRATDEVGILFLSTGPGALTSLAGLQEAYATGVPMMVVASQIPTEGIGARRKGMLHQLDDQKSSAANVTKSQRLVQHSSGIPSALQDAWSEAISSPQGPVWVEIPQDVLLEPVIIPPIEDVLAVAFDNPPRKELVEEAVRWLTEAKNPLVIAGGGVRRAHAEAELLELAEKLNAPVLSTPGGNGAFPWSHELSLQNWVEDRYMTELAEKADVLLVVGSSLGEVSSNYFTMAPQGRTIQVDAEPRILESNGPALGIRADAKQALEMIVEQSEKKMPKMRGGEPERWRVKESVAETLRRVQDRLDAQDLAVERRFMADIRHAVPEDMQTFWDMTISSYWAWSCWDARASAGGKFHSAQGAGGLGYAFPAAVGAALGLKKRVFAVAGDGSALYSIAELATAKQYCAPVTWLIVDDGGYGILREYMIGAFGKATATELDQPDFVALARAFGVQAENVDIAHVGAALERAFKTEGPNVVVVKAVLKMFKPTHLERAAKTQLE